MAKKLGPKARNIERMKQKSITEQAAYRDRHEAQRLERTVPERPKTGRAGQIASVVVGLVVFLLAWMLWSFVQKVASGLVNEISPLGLDQTVLSFDLFKVLFTALAGLLVYMLLAQVLKRQVETENLLLDHSDINEHADDQHLALPDEHVGRYDLFPDAGAHSSVRPTSMISHLMFSNKGLAPVSVSRWATEDVLDADGDVEYHEGAIIHGPDGKPVQQKKSMIDTDFGQELFTASGLPEHKALRRLFHPKEMVYNPKNADREKVKGYDTVADLVNGDWEIPWYEKQRPAGAYVVSTAPVNTMVLAITRAGKGQTYIEPMIDMWTREKTASNMVINDPKGELLRKFYVAATKRGYQVVQFNLINALKTDIYNPLGMAADAAREGNFAKCATYVENIADVFFPIEGADDPMWPTAANNAFKRAAYGLIDYYLEEERELREEALAGGIAVETLESQLDQLWGKVTLYNCYQLFVQLTAKRLKSPLTELAERAEAGEYGDDYTEDAEYEADLMLAELKEPLWDGEKEQDMLTLYFNATAALPQSSMRRLVTNADNALRSMGKAEKMLASVYGIAITAMSFFTDPTISTLTSGRPSQNTDLGSFSFPRRIGVRFNPEYIARNSLIGLQVVWQGYSDKEFTQSLGKDFYHEDTVSREGWAKAFFKGVFPTDVAYLKLELKDAQKGMLQKTFYFRFTKSYQMSLNGRYYVTDPVLGEKIVRDGYLLELTPQEGAEGQEVFAEGHREFPEKRLKIVAGMQTQVVDTRTPAIMATQVRYSEKPKALFLVTPPHLMKYAKLILILIKQLVDLNFDSSYMTKADQKPQVRTRYMLDELGNLQSEGQGIASFATMLSIGLGQEQQFTLILQTLQQLRDVYGESVDKIVQGNTNNIVFLKSTDDTMIETLSNMSGTHHVSRRSSKSVTQDKRSLVKGLANEGKVSYTISTEAEPLLSKNDFMMLQPCNSIVFSAGDPPIWNRNETIMPMAWRLLRDQLNHPGHEYTLQTIPTLSTAMEFNVNTNQPDFPRMLSKRIGQAAHSERAQADYKRVYDYSDYQIEQLDPDMRSAEVMSLVQSLGERLSSNGADHDYVEGEMGYEWDENSEVDNTAERDAEVDQATTAYASGRSTDTTKRYAGGQISRSDMFDTGGNVLVGFAQEVFVEAYLAARPQFEKDQAFDVDENGSLRLRQTGDLLIHRHATAQDQVDAELLSEAARNPDSKVYSEDAVELENATDAGQWTTTRELVLFLSSLDSWAEIADGQFEQQVAARYTHSMSTEEKLYDEQSEM